jgi:SAM-dependent methyltransferase
MEPLNARGSTQWLHDRGWICPWVFWEGDFLENDQLWNDLQALGWAEASAKSDSHSWLMFNPCPILESSIGDIEEKLRKSRIPSMSHEAFSCLDIGCGSGRDLAWLLSRNSHTAHPMWQAVAVDSSYGAAKRTKAICDNMGLSAQLLSSINAKVLANGQWKLVEKGNPGMTTLDSKKKSNFIPGHPTVDFFSQIVQQKLNSCIPQQYDLIITIRFLVRSLLPQLPLLLKPGGYMILSHFVDHGQYTYDQPRPEHRLQLHELADLYGSMRGMSVIVDKLEEIEDGRPVNSVIIRKDPAI